MFEQVKFGAQSSEVIDADDETNTSDGKSVLHGQEVSLWLVVILGSLNYC